MHNEKNQFNSYVFIKTGKCGSTYIRKYLSNCNYCKKSETLEASYGGILKNKNYNKYLLTVNHVDYNTKLGYIEHFNKIMKYPVKYITCVRDPLKRAISHYYSDRPSELNYNEWYRKFHTNKYMNSHHYTNLTNNYMSNYLGFNSIDEITEENILNRYELVIIMEQINKGIKKLSNILNTKYKELDQINRNKEYSSQPEIDDDVRILFNKNNEMDNKLYTLCCKLY